MHSKIEEGAVKKAKWTRYKQHKPASRRQSPEARRPPTASRAQGREQPHRSRCLAPRPPAPAPPSAGPAVIGRRKCRLREQAATGT
jgi:hypothetical protein